MSPPKPRHLHAAAPHHPFFENPVSPHQELADGLRKLGLSLSQVVELLHPKPDSSHENIRIGFPGLEFWMNDFGARKSRDMHSMLNVTLHQYEQVRQHYLKDVRENLLKLKHYRTGRAVLDEIRTKHHFVLINPYRPQDEDDQNARTEPLHRADAAPLGMTVLDSDGDVILDGDTAEIGTGKGTNVRVWYSPAMWADRSRGPASAPDEILLHELIHASRQVSGVSRRVRVKKYDNEEELIAIMIDNIYLSEKNQRIFRGTHAANEDGNHDILRNPRRFLDNSQHLNIPPYRAIELLRMRQPKLYVALAAIGPGPGPGRANFNPIRDWEKQRSNVLIDL
jgi:Effector protein